jgi:hypothetical protein
MTISNAHPNEDVEERLKVIAISMTLAFKNLDCHKLHRSCSVTSPTWHTVQLFRQIEINQSPFRVLLSNSIRDDDVVPGNIPMKEFPPFKK